MAAKLGRSLGKSRTDKQRLSGCAITDLNTFLLDIKRNNPDFAADTLDYLSRNYGTECDAILKLAREDPALAETRQRRWRDSGRGHVCYTQRNGPHPVRYRHAPHRHRHPW
ncbi:MAG: hypothetical protein MZV70_24290 [Desulfobacterales bacterium]|nr:hypothetical protein [Desulfobacterales bacterium]